MDQKHTVLVVDDDPILRDSVVAILEEAGYQTLTAENGKEGLETALREHPEVALFDQQMPEMTGMEAIEKLRSDAWGATANVIIMTNVNDMNLVNNAMQFGVRDYLIKSDISLDSLKDLVAGYLPAA